MSGPPVKKRPASSQLTGKKKTRSAIAAESTFSDVLDRALARTSIAEEKLWQLVVSSATSLENIQAWMAASNELRIIAGHLAKLKGGGK